MLLGSTNVQTVIVTLFRYRFFFILISLRAEVSLIIHTKFQPNILCHSGKKMILMVFAIFSIGRLLGFSTRLTFIGVKPCRQIMLHVKFEIHSYSGFREKVI